jgi:uncharacterized repeat protein (TIGR03803 family)
MLVAITALFITSYLPRATGATRVEFVLHSFGKSSEDGKYPMAGLVFDQFGAAYGTTTQGGAYGAGVVFKLTPVGSLWRETVLYDFRGTTDGATPYGGVVLDSLGNLYGETIGGGTGTCFYQNVTGCGVVYELTPPSKGTSWDETVIYTFTGGDDGATPSGSLTFDKSGDLFGTTLFGGELQEGTVFELLPSNQEWTETVLHNFGGVADGREPAAGVVFDADGNLWGTTTSGGQNLYWGTIFEMVPSANGEWAESVLYSFDNGPEGGQPAAALIFDRKGLVYSTTLSGGTTGNGTVFDLVPPSTGGGAWVENVLYSFQDGRDGGFPEAGLVFDRAGNLYGTTHSGGEAGAGAVFKLTPPAQGSGAWSETTLHSFSNGRDGGLPDSSLSIRSDGYLFGTSYVGGYFEDGTVFKIKP